MSEVAIPTGSTAAEPPSGNRTRGRFWDLVWIGATTHFRHRYAGSALSYLWAILQPLALFAVLHEVFTRVVRFGGNIEHYPMILLLNIALFFFFREATTAALRSFVGRGSVLRSIQVNPLAMPLSAILSSIFVFGFSLAVVLVWTLAYGIEPSVTWLYFPLLLVYLIGLVVVVGVLLASLFVRFRDIGMFWQSFERLLMFASPVLFTFELIPGGTFQTIAAFNPLSPMFVQLRAWMIDPDAPSWPDTAGGTFETIIPFVVFAGLGVAAAVAFSLARRRLAENL